MRQESGFTLSYATELSRKALKVGGLSILAFLVVRFAFLSFVAYWKATHPPAPPPPTVGFGVLPKINFPDTDKQLTPQQFVLETKDGRFPDFPDRAKVFLMPKNSPNLFDHEKALSIAAKYNFVFEPQIVDKRTYRWQKTNPLLSTFELDVLDNVFFYQTDFMNRPDLLLSKQGYTRFDALEQTRNFIAKANLLTNEIATSSGKLTYLKSAGSQLIKADTPLDADYVQVDIQRSPIDDEYLAYTQNGEEGIVHAILGSIKGLDTSVLRMRYAYYPIDYSQVHTYPLKSPKKAWDILQAGEGCIISNESSSQAVIRDISIGYYDDIDGQEYFQPIYVFKGDDDFLAFVPAIESKYIEIIN